MGNQVGTGLVGLVAGIGTGVYCRKKLKRGWGGTILSGIVASGIASTLTYNLAEVTNNSRMALKPPQTRNIQYLIW